MLKFETYDDAVYAHTDYVKFLRRPEFRGLMNAWLEDRDNKYGETASVPSLVAFQHALPDALGTDILWLTTEMMDLVQSAMHGFETSEPVRLDDIFLKDGFLVLPHAFMSKDVNDKTLGWRLLVWKTLDPLVTFTNDEEGQAGYTYDTSFEGEREPGVRFMQISWSWDDDDWADEYPELRDELRDSGENWGIAHATAIPLRYMNDEREMSGEGDRSASWLLFWRVMQKLMAEKIVQSDPRVPGRPARREAKRFELPPSILRVIELRRKRTNKDESEERENGSARHYTHRWIVRGHWRNQWYPSEGRHKQKYIHEYVAGPEDLDLIVKTRVWNWDR